VLSVLVACPASRGVTSRQAQTALALLWQPSSIPHYPWRSAPARVCRAPQVCALCPTDTEALRKVDGS
jgi:hypothetical protein